MSDTPNTDWDLMHRRQWFRRSQWQKSFRSTKQGFCHAVQQLAREAGAQVVLDCDCGLGSSSICLAETGLNVLGADSSEVAVTHARELASAESISVTFFNSGWSELPQNAPHHFDAVFSDSIAGEPEWDRLGAAFVGIFHIIKPGGFFAFAPSETAEEQAEEWEHAPHKEVLWFYRDGQTTCACVREKHKSVNFIDDQMLYVVDDAGDLSLESTVCRRPGYWTEGHWRELAGVAGFCHFESRTFDVTDEQPVNLLIAWKQHEDELQIDEEGRNAPYID